MNLTLSSLTVLLAVSHCKRKERHRQYSINEG